MGIILQVQVKNSYVGSEQKSESIDLVSYNDHMHVYRKAAGLLLCCPPAHVVWRETAPELVGFIKPLFLTLTDGFF